MLESATGKAQLAVQPEQTEAKPGEIVYIAVNVIGDNGIVESNADRTVTVTVEGGELLAFGSANPCTTEQYHTGTFTTYYGRAMAIVRMGNTNLKLTASDGGQSVSAVISRNKGGQR